MCLCVCVCVREREREREMKKEREREREDNKPSEALAIGSLDEIEERERWKLRSMVDLRSIMDWSWI